MGWELNHGLYPGKRRNKIEAGRQEIEAMLSFDTESLEPVDGVVSVVGSCKE